jgi:hypothetical protein
VRTGETRTEEQMGYEADFDNGRTTTKEQSTAIVSLFSKELFHLCVLHLMHIRRRHHTCAKPPNVKKVSQVRTRTLMLTKIRVNNESCSSQVSTIENALDFGRRRRLQ